MDFDELRTALLDLEKRGVKGVERALNDLVIKESPSSARRINGLGRHSKLRFLIEQGDGGFWIYEAVLDATDGRREHPHQPWQAPADVPRDPELALAAMELVG